MFSRRLILALAWAVFLGALAWKPAESRGRTRSSVLRKRSVALRVSRSVRPSVPLASSRWKSRTSSLLTEEWTTLGL